MFAWGLKIEDIRTFLEPHASIENDTLIDIAKKYGIDWKTLYNKNKDIIGKNPNPIKPGQILKI